MLTIGNMRQVSMTTDLYQTLGLFYKKKIKSSKTYLIKIQISDEGITLESLLNQSYPQAYIVLYAQ